MPDTWLSRRRFLVAATLAGLAGCTRSADRPAAADWPQFGHDPQNTGSNPAADGPAGPVTERWRRDVGASSAPVVAAGTLYVAVGDGRRRGAGSAESDDPSGGGGSRGGDGRSGSREQPGLVALDAADGTPRWRYRASTGVTMPAVGSGVVCVGSADGTVLGLSPSGGYDLPTGRLGLVRWRAAARDPPASPPTIRGDAAYLGGFGARVLALTVDGEATWRFQSSGDAVETAPAVDGGSVYFSVGDLRGGAAFSVDATAGTVGWRFPLGEFPGSAPVLADGTVFVGSDTDHLYALDATTGRVQWRRSVGGVRASPAVTGGVVYAPAVDGTVYALDAGDGGELWTVGLDGPLTCSPAVAGDAVYAGTGGDALVALAAGTGRVRWRRGLDAPVLTAPAVTGGTVYVSTEAGTVVALGPE